MKSWRRLEDVFRLRLQKTSSSIRIRSPYSYVFRKRLQDVFKMSWSRPIYLSWLYVFKTSSRRFQDVFKILTKTSSRRFEDVFKTSLRHLRDVLPKTSSKRLQDVLHECLQDIFKTSCKLQDVLQRCLQDIFETYHQVKYFA